MPKKCAEGGSSAIWTREATHIFCDLCIKEIEIGNRPTTHFSKDGWQNIATRFKELAGRDYEKRQFKNKWDQLKKEWKTWKDLKRGSTGLGWDPLKRTISASDAWWEEKIKALSAAKKFRQSGIEPELEEKMDIMFKDVVATGKHSTNPSELGFDDTSDDLPSEQIMGDEDLRSITEINRETSSSSKKPRLAKKRRNNDTAVNSSIDRLIDAFVVPQTAALDDTSITDCIAALDDIPEAMSDIIFYGKCVKNLEEKTRRQMFMALHPDRRIGYLRALADE